MSDVELQAEAVQAEVDVLQLSRDLIQAELTDLRSKADNFNQLIADHIEMANDLAKAHELNAGLRLRIADLQLQLEALKPKE